MINKTESELMAKWQGEMMVSITCVAFNHEYCIEETMDSFLMQETNFPFEIIINDDVSTDRTVEILKDYEIKFPNIVKPVYQSKNQFSQGINTMALLFPKVTGKYVAFCDGDDYWTDKDKLSIQVAEMEKHPEIDMSFHSDRKLVGSQQQDIQLKHADGNKMFSAEEMILGGGNFCPTASLMFTNRLLPSLPDWFYKAIPGDFVGQIMGSVRNGALYIDRCMSIYRVGVETSWTVSESQENSEKRKLSLLNFNEKLTLINNTFDKRFQKEVDQVTHEENLDFIKTRSIDSATREEVFQTYKGSFSAKEKALWYLLYRNQNLLNALKHIKYGADSTFKRLSL